MWKGYKSRYFPIQPSYPKRRKTRNGATSFLEFLTDFPECMRTKVNQMSNVQEAGLTDLENQMKQADFASCPLINMKVVIDSLLLKKKKLKMWKEIKTEIKVEKVLYH